MYKFAFFFIFYIERKSHTGHANYLKTPKSDKKKELLDI